MPTYEYTCKACGENFDIVQSFSDKPLKKHPGGCGGPVQKVFHASGIVFKGSGFYVTDSRGASSVKSKSDSSSSSTSSSSTSSSSSSSTSSKSDTSSKSTSSD